MSLTAKGKGFRAVGAISLVGLAAIIAIASIAAPSSVALATAIGLPIFVGGAYLAFRNFEAFLILTLILRPLLDVTKSASLPIDLTAVVGVAVLVVSLTWLSLNWRHTLHRALSPLALGLMVFAIISTLAIVSSQDITASIAEATRLVSGVVLFFTVDTLLAKGMPIRRMLGTLLIAAAFPLIMPLLGKIVGFELFHFKDGLRALRSTFHLSNNFAHFLAPFVIVMVAYARRMRGGRLVAVLAIIAVALFELILTITRGAWLAVLVGVVVIGMIENRRLVVAVIALALSAYLLVPAVQERVADLSADPTAPRSQNSLGWRINHWSEIIRLADDSPLLGIGPGMTSQVSVNEKTPHSDYVRSYVETGLLGLGAYVFLLGTQLFVSYRALQQSENRYRPLALGMFAYSCAFAITSAGENLVTTVSFLWFVMPLLAITNYLAYPPVEQECVRGTIATYSVASHVQR